MEELLTCMCTVRLWLCGLSLNRDCRQFEIGLFVLPVHRTHELTWDKCGDLTVGAQNFYVSQCSIHTAVSSKYGDIQKSRIWVENLSKRHTVV